MVLTNASSRARNMTQTNNRPQSADFGSIYPSVGISAYGSRNRRQRGIYNIAFWDAVRPKTNGGRTTGRVVEGARGSAWNVKGTSTNSILIDNVTFATQRLTAATTAYNTAKNLHTQQNGQDAIDAMNTAHDGMQSLLGLQSTSTVASNDTNYTLSTPFINNTSYKTGDDATTHLAALTTYYNMNQLTNTDYTLNTNLESTGNTSITDIYNFKVRLMDGLDDVNAFATDVSGGIDITALQNTFAAADLSANYAIEREAAYRSTNAEKTAANSALQKANAAVY